MFWEPFVLFFQNYASHSHMFIYFTSLIITFLNQLGFYFHPQQMQVSTSSTMPGVLNPKTLALRVIEGFVFSLSFLPTSHLIQCAELSVLHSLSWSIREDPASSSNSHQCRHKQFLSL